MMSPNFKRDWTRAHVLWSLSVTALRRRYLGELLGTTSGTESRTCRCCAPRGAGDALELPAADTDGVNTLCRRDDGVKGLPPPKPPPPPPCCHSLEHPLSADLSAAVAFGVLPRRRLLMCRPATPPNIPPHLKSHKITKLGFL